MTKVHPLAHVDPGAELADGVEVGAFSYVEAGAIVGARTRIDPHVVIRSGTILGEENVVSSGVVLGGEPQDRRYQGEPTRVRIGHRNFIREYVTIHKATGEGNETSVGDDNYIMASCHIAHNVTVGSQVTIANTTGISGYCTIEDLVTIGGMVGVHQFCRIGKVAMLGGMTRVVRDVPPFMLTEGANQDVHDINAIGLRRLGVTPQARLALHKACKLLFKSMLGLTSAMETVRREVPMTPEVEYLLAFEARRFSGKHGRGDQR